MTDVPLGLPYQQPSNERSVFALFCQLSGLAHQSVYLIHDPSKQLTAKTLLHHYTKYLLWYDSLPEALRLGQNFTPHVLFAQLVTVLSSSFIAFFVHLRGVLLD